MTVVINGNGTITGLSVVPDPGANGMVARTSSTTSAARTITAGTGVSVSNGDGVSGNPTITNSGVTSAVAGTGISVSGATGAVTVTNTGVTSVTAGSNISVSASTGGVTISSTAGAPTTAQVLSATAGASALAVGTYAFLIWQAGASGGEKSAGYTLAGSNLKTTCVMPAGDGSFAYSIGAAQSGTWMLMGHLSNNFPNESSVWLRIS